MKRFWVFALVFLIFGLSLVSCNLYSIGDNSLEGTRMALGFEQTRIAMNQTQIAQTQPGTTAPQEMALQPTYTLYPTYTAQVEQQPQDTTALSTQEPELQQSFEDWMGESKILIYDAMYGRGDTPVIENAIDGLGLGANTTNAGTAIGDFLSNMNSATKWDLIIIGSEFRSQFQGELFDVLVDQIDRGSSIVVETWYIDQVFHGRVQPVMQRCGITFHRDWWRDNNANLNEYLIYLLDPDDPLFSNPNTISMLSPYDIRWIDDVGDTVELIPGSGATLLAGTQAKEHSSYGLITECLDGRMIWQTFSTHDYKDQDMINLWQNYIYNTLQARYESLQ